MGSRSRLQGEVITAPNITISITANAVVGERPPIYEEARAYINARYEPDPVTGCWRWTGPLTRDGYGHIGAQRIVDQIAKGAHRVSKIVFHGWQPNGRGEQIRHQCHQRNCVNPSHMLTGAAAENAADKRAAGTTGIKLRAAYISIIRLLMAKGEKSVVLAGLFDVHPDTISNIKHGVTWRHITLK